MEATRAESGVESESGERMERVRQAERIFLTQAAKPPGRGDIHEVVYPSGNMSMIYKLEGFI